MIIQHEEHPIERIMDNAFVKMKGLISADTVLGEPITTADGVNIIPISKVTMGFLTGGGEYSDMSREEYNQYPFAGGSGAGMSVAPIGFLVGTGNELKLVGVSDEGLYDKILSLIPEVMASLIKRNGEKN